MLRRLLSSLVGILAVLAVVLAPLGSPAGASSPGPGPAFGSQFHGMWSDYTDAQRAQVLDTLQAHGTEWVRLDVSWAMLQPDRAGVYSEWGVGYVDRVLDMITARGMKPLVTLWLTPAWANGDRGERTLPDDPQAYAAAAGWAAARWAGQVGAWEVWNEPNDDHFMTGADPAAYARLLRAAYPSLKAGDPQAAVVFGGPMYNDADWIGKVYAAGAAGSFDVMATHPYQGVADQSPDVDDGTKWTLLHVRAVHDLMVANGDGHKPIWFTEFGWSSHPNTGGEENWNRGVTREQQADYLVRTLELVAAELPYVTHVFWYNERDRGTDGSQLDSSQLDNYGLMTRDLTPKPALLALKAHQAGRIAGPAPSDPSPPVTPAPPSGPLFAVVDCPTAPSVVSAPVVLCPPQVYTK